jgi:hypothetical protein
MIFFLAQRLSLSRINSAAHSRERRCVAGSAQLWSVFFGQFDQAWLPAAVRFDWCARCETGKQTQLLGRSGGPQIRKPRVQKGGFAREKLEIEWAGAGPSCGARREGNEGEFCPRQRLAVVIRRPEVLGLKNSMDVSAGRPASVLFP